MTTAAQPAAPGMFGSLRKGVSAAARRVADMDLDRRISPLVDNGRQAVHTGLKTAAHVRSQARDFVSQEALWQEQHALVDSLIEVLSLQQALIEDLRARVSSLESAR